MRLPNQHQDLFLGMRKGGTVDINVLCQQAWSIGDWFSPSFMVGCSRAEGFNLVQCES